MTEVNPPLYLDQDDAYGADDLGLPYRDIMGEGVVGTDDLEVTADTGLKCSVAAGAAWIQGDDDADTQPTYRVRNDAAVLLQHDAADATNPRIDLVISEVLDSTFSGVSKLWRLRIVKGTAAASPDAPDLPDNAIPLAEVDIAAGSGTLGTITDRRVRASVGGGSASSGRTLAYNEITSNAAVGTSISTIVTADEVTVDGDTPVCVEFFTPRVNAATAAQVITTFHLYEGSTDLGEIGEYANDSSSAKQRAPVKCEFRFTPASGAHTYAVKALTDTSTSTVGAGAGGTGLFVPMFIRVRRDD